MTLFLAVSASAFAESDADLWTKLAAGGYVVAIRPVDSLAPESPTSVQNPESCNKRSELSERGRLTANRHKTILARHGISAGRVLTCRACPCVQTAGVIVGRAEPWSIIDDLQFDNPQRRAEKTAALKEAVSRWSSHENLLLVSHSSNLQDAFAVAPGLKQLLVIKPLGDDGYRVVGVLSSD